MVSPINRVLGSIHLQSVGINAQDLKLDLPYPALRFKSLESFLRSSG
jgi:hypothetical protein